MYLNKIFLIGNLTRDPELKSLPSGTKVATFGLATNRKYKDQDGNWQDATDFHNIVVFGRQAETTSQYLSKGSMAMIEGRVQTRSWEADDGSKRYRTEVVADRVQFGPKGSGGGDSQVQKGQSEAEGSQVDSPSEEDEGINVDDIPF